MNNAGLCLTSLSHKQVRPALLLFTTANLFLGDQALNLTDLRPLIERLPTLTDFLA